MSNPHIISARHAQGLAAYRSGQTVADLVGIAEEFDRMHDDAKTPDEHREIANSGPSLIAGYADGLIEDIRLLAAARRGQRA